MSFTHPSATHSISASQGVVGPSLTPKNRLGALLIFLILLCLSAVLAPPIAQDPHYHHFADQLQWMGIAHPLDVLSNLPFLVLGLLGWRQTRTAMFGQGQRVYLRVFFGGLVLTFLGSSWYHLNPNDQGLLVDRLGMAVAFAGLLGCLALQQVHDKAAMPMLVGSLLAGGFAVVTCYVTGQLLYWVLLQAGGLVLILGFGALPPLAGHPQVKWLWIVMLYGLAKVLELNDHAIFELSQGWVSGHALKHVVAAAAALPLLKWH